MKSKFPGVMPLVGSKSNANELLKEMLASDAGALPANSPRALAFAFDIRIEVLFAEALLSRYGVALPEPLGLSAVRLIISGTDPTGKFATAVASAADVASAVIAVLTPP